MLGHEDLQGFPGGADAEAVDRHGVQDLIGQHQAPEPGGEAGQPLAASGQVRDLVGEQFPLAGLQVRTRLQDQIAFRQGTQTFQTVQELDGQCAAPGTEFEYITPTESGQGLSHLDCDTAAKEWRDLGGGHEIPPGAEFGGTSDVIAEPGGIER